MSLSAYSHQLECWTGLSLEFTGCEIKIIMVGPLIIQTTKELEILTDETWNQYIRTWLNKPHSWYWICSSSNLGYLQKQSIHEKNARACVAFNSVHIASHIYSASLYDQNHVHFRVAFYCGQPKAHLCNNHAV